MKLEITIEGRDSTDEIEIRYLGGRHRHVTVKVGSDADLHAIITVCRAMLGERGTRTANELSDGGAS